MPEGITIEEAYKTCETITKDRLAAKILVDKYFLQDPETKLYTEHKPEHLWDRLAKAISQAEIKQLKKEFELKFRDLLEDFKFVPGGRILYGLGNPYANITLKNCYVIDIQEDSIKGIFDTAYKMAETYKAGGGCGIDISRLRPKGLPVHNAARTSSGSVSFMQFFSTVTGMIGQNGRIGALLISIDVDHPDIMDFIKIKGGDDLDLVRYANVSVKITDEFMRAVEDDGEYDLKWNGQVFDTVPARKVWNEIIHRAWKRGEPGMLFWDTVKRTVPAHHYGGFGCVTTNPCITGDTRILTDSGYKTARQLWAEGEYQEYISRDQGLVLDIMTINGPGKATRVYRTSKSEKIFRVLLDNGSYIDATSNHKFIKTDGSRIELLQLNKGDELWSYEDNNKFKSKIISISYLKIDETFCLTEPKTNSFVANGVIIGNCGETLLSHGDSCNLGSMNLSKYVKDPFSSEAEFDYDKFGSDVKLAVRFLDNIITLEKAPQEFQQWANDNGRRLGLGIMGLADLFLMMGMRFDDESAIELTEEVMSRFAHDSYEASCDLAVEKGAFPVYDFKTHMKSEFMQSLPEGLTRRIEKEGLRNISIHAIAPTGSLSLISQCSSGIEPVFQMKHVRKTNLGTSKKVEHHTVFHPAARKYCEIHNTEDLPDYFISAHDVDPKHRIRLQSVTNRYIDQSISNTVNLPRDCKPDVISYYYQEAWRAGCKGITVYRDGSREGVLVTESESESEIKRHKSPKRPRKLDAVVRLIKPNGKIYTVFIGFLKGRVFEVFALDHAQAGVADRQKGHIIKHKNKGEAKGTYEFESGAMVVRQLNRYEDEAASLITRLISTSLRHGVPIEFVVDQILKSQETVTSFAKAIARALTEYIDAKEAKGSFKCTDCGSSNVKFEGTCRTCQDCGSSKCS